MIILSSRKKVYCPCLAEKSFNGLADMGGPGREKGKKAIREQKGRTKMSHIEGRYSPMSPLQVLVIRKEGKEGSGIRFVLKTLYSGRRSFYQNVSEIPPP